MRNIIIAALTLLCTACTSETKYGKCIGAFDTGDSKFVYVTSVKNVMVGIIFLETVIVPAIVIAEQTKCPEELRVAP